MALARVLRNKLNQEAEQAINFLKTFEGRKEHQYSSRAVFRSPSRDGAVF